MMRQDGGEFDPGSVFVAGVSGNAKQRRLIVRRWRKMGRAVKFYHRSLYQGTYRVGVIARHTGD